MPKLTVEQELELLKIKINEAEKKRNEAEKNLRAALTEPEEPESVWNDFRALFESASQELNTLRQELNTLRQKELELIISTRVKDIATHGFPPLGKRQFYNSDDSTPCLQSNYGVVPKVYNAEFGILEEFKSEHFKKYGKCLWTEASDNAGSLRNWSGILDIGAYIKTAFFDCTSSNLLLEKVDFYREPPFSIAALMQKETKDVIAFVKDASFITGVVHVKLPGSDLDHIHQLVDYMVDLRNSFNVRYVFGVLTTYEQWKFLWFDDTQEAASCTTIAQYDELCRAGSANEYMISAGKLKVFQKSYKHDDPELIECLVSLLYKVSTTPVYHPTKFIDERSRYVLATEKSIKYTSLPKELKYFKYGLPPKQTRNFFILSHFHQGGDGFVALVSSASGYLGVVKFLHDDGNQEEMESALELEQSRWKELWQVECRIVNLNDRLGLMMPFCMPFDTDRKVFTSLQAWNKMSINDNDHISEELTECVNREQLEKYNRDPLLAAQEALATICNRNSAHLDISLRHIALLPKWNHGTKMYDFQAILIDLSRVDSGLDLESAQLSAQKALELLRNEFENATDM